MISLARKTLLREWPRYMPAILAIAFAGLLLVVQAALVLGIFGSSAVYIKTSSANIWASYPGTQSVSLGRAINPDVEMMLRMDPTVRAVEPVLWVDGDWRGKQAVGGVSVYLTGINPMPDGMMYDQILSAPLRQLLFQPGAVIVDRADLDSLGVELGDQAWIDGRPVTVVAAVSGLRALGGVNVIASLETARSLNSGTISGPTYVVARTDAGTDASVVTQRLAGQNGFGPYELWSADNFAQRSQLYWLLDTGAGVAVLFLAVIVFFVGAVISSQALTAVVVSSAREYATLNALGASMRSLRHVVLEQAFWIGGAGLLISAVMSSVLLFAAYSRDVPVAMTPLIAFLCTSTVMGLALVSGVISMRGLISADPSMLLR